MSAVKKTFGIVFNKNKDPNLTVVTSLSNAILTQGGQISFQADISEPLEREKIVKMLNNEIAVFCLGGDGTFLKAARIIYKKKIPLIGINLGSLGFLTEIEKDNIEESVNKIITGQFTLEKRMLLQCKIIRNDEVIIDQIALNDVVIARGALSRILNIKTFVNGVFLDSFPGDGLIISTPTGSTAYSLSAGGPIMDPNVEMMILTPICPHILYSRSFVTTGDHTVTALVEDSYKNISMVTIDGQTGIDMCGGDIVEVKRSSHHIYIMKLNSMDFYHVLRKKLYYRGESMKQYEVQSTRENH